MSAAEQLREWVTATGAEVTWTAGENTVSVVARGGGQVASAHGDTVEQAAARLLPVAQLVIPAAAEPEPDAAG